MLNLSKARRYFIYHDITDMRKGVDSLCGIVRNEFKANPLSGDVFIFFNRRKIVVKLLCWDDDGFCIFYKRLEKGCYELPHLNGSSKQMLVSSETLTCILYGISLASIKKRKRYFKAA